MNRAKSVLLAKDFEGFGTVHDGVPVQTKMKYLGMTVLGMTVSLDRGETIRAAETAVNRIVNTIRNNFRCQDDNVKNMVVTAYGRSPLRYHYTPLYAVGTVTAEDIRTKES
jgi:hypothetical protein